MRRGPVQDETFDLVYNSGVLEHFPEEESLQMAQEMARITKKGGYVVIILPNKYCLWFRLYKKIAQLGGFWEFGYEREYSVPMIKKLARESNLEIKRLFGLQAMVALATNKMEIVPLSLRKHLIGVDKLFPWKQYYGFGVGIICKKI